MEIVIKSNFSLINQDELFIINAGSAWGVFEIVGGGIIVLLCIVAAILNPAVLATRGFWLTAIGGAALIFKGFAD